MNKYQIEMHSNSLEATRAIIVSCNNVPFAVEKARKELIIQTKVSDWKYVSSKLVYRAGQD